MPTYSVVDLFCGSGGMSLGFLRSGFELLIAVDIDQAAIDTYKLNFGSSHTCLSDLSKNVDLPKTAVVIGGPPCQGFSSAGKRQNWDTRNSLVSCFAKFVAALRPQGFVFENVEGFLTADHGARVLDLLGPLLKAGYRIHLRKINAANYGIPQHRKRVLAIGGLGWNPSFPSATHTAFGAPGAHLAARTLPLCPTVMDALAGLPVASVRPPGCPQGHYYRALEGIDLQRASALKPGQTMRDLPDELHHDSYRRRAYRRVMDGTPSEQRGGAPAGVRRLRPDEPSKAITGGARSEFIHPLEDRNLTIRECARLQTFPDDFVFSGNPSEQMQLIGNAVPPKLGEVIAMSLARNLQSAIRDSVARGALLSFVPSLSEGFSPALKSVTTLVQTAFHEYIESDERLLWTEEIQEPMKDVSGLSKTQQAFITKIRATGAGDLGISLDDPTCCYLVGTIVNDLGLQNQFPAIFTDLPPFFSDTPLSDLRLTGQDFSSLFGKLTSAQQDTDTYFYCLATLHRARLKYEKILRAQPMPTIQQVGPRALLQFGTISPKALAGFLFWRKWIFDIDNRAAQETGYVFEPIIAHAIGGVPASGSRSPIRRSNNPSKGRQVDCVRAQDRRAYEIKLRVTIAASGQGRWAEELSFPVDCRKSEYTPVLLVLDPTPNPKLAELSDAFRRVKGEVFVGADAWKHLEGEAGATMATFIRKYVHDPIQLLLGEASEDVPDLLLHMDDEQFVAAISGEILRVPRQVSQELSSEPEEPEAESEADDTMPDL